MPSFLINLHILFYLHTCTLASELFAFFLPFAKKTKKKKQHKVETLC